MPPAAQSRPSRADLPRPRPPMMTSAALSGASASMARAHSASCALSADAPGTPGARRRALAKEPAAARSRRPKSGADAATTMPGTPRRAAAAKPARARRTSADAGARSGPASTTTTPPARTLPMAAARVAASCTAPVPRVPAPVKISSPSRSLPRKRWRRCARSATPAGTGSMSPHSRAHRSNARSSPATVAMRACSSTRARCPCTAARARALATSASSSRRSVGRAGSIRVGDEGSRRVRARRRRSRRAALDGDGHRRLTTRARFRIGHFPSFGGFGGAKVRPGGACPRDDREARRPRPVPDVRRPVRARRAGTVTPFAVSPACRERLSRLQCDDRAASGPVRSTSWRMIVSVRRETRVALRSGSLSGRRVRATLRAVVEGEDSRRQSPPPSRLPRARGRGGLVVSTKLPRSRSGFRLAFAPRESAQAGRLTVR